VVTLGISRADPNTPAKRPDPAKIRCYSPADGKLIHELPTAFAGIDTDRIQGNFLLSVGYASNWVTRGNSMRYTPQPPIAYDVWELPARDKVRAFDLDAKRTVALGPGGRYMLRVREDNAVEVFEPFALKAVVTTVPAPARPDGFEFSPDGGRVAVSLTDASVVVWDTGPWDKAIGERLARAVPADLAPLWDDLAKDATAGLRAARLLSAAGERAVTLLGGKVAVRKGPDEARVRQWLADLDSPRFAVREKAEKDLRDLSGQAEPFLRKELDGTRSAEVKQRIASLLAAVEAGKLGPAELRDVRAVQALEWVGTDAGRKVLAQWAKGDPSAPLTKSAVRASSPRPVVPMVSER
jgi:hypothetical protein